MNAAPIPAVVPASESSRFPATWKLVLSLVLLAACWISLARSTTTPIDGLTKLQSWFDVAQPPAPWRVDQARKLADGTLAVILSDPSAAPEAPRKSPEPAPASGPSGPLRNPWDDLVLGEQGTAPIDLTVLQFPLQRGAREIERRFRGPVGAGPSGASMGESGQGQRGGDKRVLERGTLAWGSFAAPFAHERELEPGGTFRDSVRVNLSARDTPRILVARWARGLPASKARLQELLDQLPPR